MGVLPRPYSGALRALTQRAVGLAHGVDERDIAVVSLNRLVDELKDALCSRERHRHRVELLRDHAYGSHEVAGELQKGGNRAERERAHAHEAQVARARYRERAARNSHYDIEHIAEVAVERHEYIREPIRLGGVVTQLVVALVEISLGVAFVAEYLDDLLTVNHLLNIAVEAAERALLLEEILRAVFSDVFRRLKHERHKAENHEAEPHACDEHRGAHHHERRHRGYNLRQRV